MAPQRKKKIKTTRTMNIPLYTYDEMPKDMRQYLSFNGWHFNKAANDYAVSMMRKRNKETGRMESIKPLSKEQVDEMLQNNGVRIDNKGGYDYVYVANMCLADRWGSSIEDERHLCLDIKDTCDDVDVAEDSVMICWYAKMKAKGVPIPWSELL